MNKVTAVTGGGKWVSVLVMMVLEQVFLPELSWLAVLKTADVFTRTSRVEVITVAFRWWYNLQYFFCRDIDQIIL